MLTNEHTGGQDAGTTGQQIFIVATHKAILHLGWKIFYIGKQGFITFADAATELKIVYLDDKVQITGTSPNPESIPGYIEEFKEAFQRAVATTGAEAATREYATISQSFKHEDIDSVSGNKNRLRTILDYFIPIKNFFITPLLIDINLLIYIIMVCAGVHFIEPDGQSMLAWGANFKPITLAGEWWRMFTSCFIHFGILHVALNMYALAFIGVLLEPLIGRSRYFTAYILTGIAASAASLWWNDFVVSAGASGAVFGMFGVFIGLMASGVVPKPAQKALLPNIAFFVILNLVIGFSQTGIDNAAHVGGLISGFFIGLVMVPGLKNRQSSALHTGGIVAAAVIGLGAALYAYNYTNNDLSKYETLIQEFSVNEKVAIDAFKGNENATDAQAAIIIKDKILPVWKKNGHIAGEIENLDLTDSLEERSKLIKKYSTLQIENYSLLYKKATENSNVYDKRIEQIQVRILATLKKANPDDNKESK